MLSLKAVVDNRIFVHQVDVSVLATIDDSNDLNFNQYLEEKEIPMPQRVYVCKFCNKPFKRKDHYKIHLHIHTGVKSFFCPDCGKGTSEFYSLTS